MIVGAKAGRCQRQKTLGAASLNKTYSTGFSSGYGALGVGMEGAWRFWTSHKPCAPYPQLPVVIEQFEHLGREIK
jgi:hypothetical protein